MLEPFNTRRPHSHSTTNYNVSSPSIHITEVLSPTDPQCRLPKFEEARKKGARRSIQKRHMETRFTYVGDSIFVGANSFEKNTDMALEKFESRERMLDNFEFAGMDVKSSDAGITHQSKQADRLSILDSHACDSEFKSRLMQRAWLVHTHPEIAFGVVQLGQVTEECFSSNSVKKLNKATLTVKSNPSRGLLQQKLDKQSLSIRVYTDSSFANNWDSTSQPGYLVVLCEKYGKCNLLHYKFYKSRRVTRSFLGAEIYAFADGFDCANNIKHDLDGRTGLHEPLTMMTDSKSLSDVITKNSSTSEKRLMINISAAGEVYERHDVSQVAHGRSGYNPADAFTKIGHCPALEGLIVKGVADHDVMNDRLKDKGQPSPFTFNISSPPLSLDISYLSWHLLFYIYELFALLKCI